MYFTHLNMVKYYLYINGGRTWLNGLKTFENFGINKIDDFFVRIRLSTEVQKSISVVNREQPYYSNVL